MTLTNNVSVCLCLSVCVCICFADIILIIVIVHSLNFIMFIIVHRHHHHVVIHHTSCIIITIIHHQHVRVAGDGLSVSGVFPLAGPAHVRLIHVIPRGVSRVRHVRGPGSGAVRAE